MAKRAVNIALLYTLFAVLSTVVNIGSQVLSVWLYKGIYFVEISIFVGTVTGLPLRYYLEKRYIFAFTCNNLAYEGKVFIFYSTMAVVTTLIFWGTEYAFYLIFDNDLMRYTGGLIGLVVGFYVKYQLDRRYVFVNNLSEMLH